VRGGSLAREEACCVKKKRARADRQDRLAAAGLPGKKAQEDGVIDLNARALAPRNKEIVQRRARLEGDMRDDGEALGAENRFKGLRDDEAGVGPFGESAPESEHLPRADKIEFLDLREYDDAEFHLFFLDSLIATADWHILDGGLRRKEALERFAGKQGLGLDESPLIAVDIGMGPPDSTTRPPS